jgi:4-amino-4-deoxy-L-arabinose transferase-like glycosyltransferase
MVSKDNEVQMSDAAAAVKRQEIAGVGIERSVFAIAVLALVVLWAYTVWAHRGSPSDDAYITYRYARNLAEGNGFVFNVGERVQSTTTPLLTIVLALGVLVGFDIPLLAFLLTTLSLLAFGACCIAFVRNADPEHYWLGIGAVALTFLSIITVYGFGTEIPLIVALAWAAWLAAAQELWILSAVLAGLASITRGDGVLIAVSIGICYLATHRTMRWRSWDWRAALVYLFVTLPWYIFAWLYFGSPLPATLGTKIAQGAGPGAVTFFQGLGYFWTRSLTFELWLWVPALVLLVVGAFAITRRGWRLSMPLIWAVLYTAGYSILGVSRYPWYYNPLMPVAALALMYGMKTIATLAVRFMRPSKLGHVAHQVIVASIFLILGVSYFVTDQAVEQSEPTLRNQVYIAVGNWIAKNTPATATLGSDEVGFLGYYSKRRIIDFVGLIQPEVVQHIAEHDNVWVIRTYQPDYILGMPVWTVNVGSDPWVQQHYSALRTFELPNSDVGTLFKKK